MTREYPPAVYGGAGVHIEYLVREMAKLAEVRVQCFGERPAEPGNPEVRAYAYEHAMFARNPRRAKGALQALRTGLEMVAEPVVADVVHCHTWYAHFGGLLARLAYGVPLVVTVHSLEPLRPWKREQLGRGYDVSSWVERTTLEAADAVVAVSESDRAEIVSRFDVSPQRVRFIPNGVDTEAYRPVAETDVLLRYGVDPDRPYVLFLSRISRQKGVGHFLRAAERLPEDAGIVLCASAPDSPEIEAEVERAVARLRARRDGVVWIREMLPREQAVQLYTHAAVFCCPSVYEPFGLTNLEAMACETAVVATAVGGIRQVVVHGETGLLVEFGPASADDPEPADPDGLADRLAEAMASLLADPARRRRMGARGRVRAAEDFGWASVARRVHALYREIVGEAKATEER